MPLSLSFFGPFQARLDHQLLTNFESRKIQALLAYLALEAGQPHSREALLGLFWPDFPQSVAQANLRNAISKLRLTLQDRDRPVPFILVTRSTVQFNPAGDFSLDIAEFQRLARQESSYPHPPGQEPARPEPVPASIARLQKKIALFRGAFLEGFSLADSPAFEEWLLLSREQLNRLLLEDLQELIELLIHLNRFNEALPYARQLVDLEPWQEENQQQLMRLLAMTGQRNAALAQFEDLRKVLREELAVEPCQETLQVYRQIRDGTLRKSTSDAPLPEPPGFMTGGDLPERERVFFAGRKFELSQLEMGLTSAIRGSGRAIFISGSPGQGKTTLAREYIRQACLAHPDLLAASGRSQAYFGKGDPFQPFREILAMLLGDVDELWASGQIGQDLARRLWLACPQSAKILVEKGPMLVDSLVSGAALLDRLKNFLLKDPGCLERLQKTMIQRQSFQDNPGQSTSVSQESLVDQTIQVLRGLANVAPLLIFIDDLQWADTSSLSLLMSLVKRLGNSRILIVGAFRSEEVQFGASSGGQPLSTLVSECQQIMGDCIIDLDGSDHHAFFEEYLDRQPNLFTPEFRGRLFELTSGSPLFTVEELSSMQENGMLIQNSNGEWIERGEIDWEILPARVEAAIRNRLSRLPGPTRELLSTASIEGENFTVEVLEELFQRDSSQVRRRVGKDLEEKSQLVRAIGRVQVESRTLTIYRFRHHLIQLYLYREIDFATRTSLHERVARAYEKLYADHSEDAAGRIAHHFVAAGLPHNAVEYLTKAGRKAERLFAYPEAIDFYSQALDLTPEKDRETRFELVLARENVYHSSGQRQAQREEIQLLEKLAQSLGPARQAQASLRKAYLAEQLWDFPALLEAAQLAITQAQVAGQVRLEAEGWMLKAIYYYAKFPHEIVPECWEKAIDLTRQSGDVWLEANVLRYYGFFTLNQDVPKALQALEESVRIFRVLNDRYGESRALGSLGLALKEQGQISRAIRVMEESRRGCREVGNRYDELWTLYELGFLYDYLGMLEKIEGDFTEAVDVSRRLENNYQACSHLYSLGILFFWRGDFEHSESLFRQAIEVVCLEKNNDYYESWINLFLGMIKVETGCLQEAEECYARAQNIFLRTSSFPPEALSSMANLKMVQGKQEEALQLVERMLPFPEPMMAFNEEPSTFCRLAAYKVLLANHDPRAEGILLEMIRIISNNADAIEDPEQRQAFLTKAPWNREFLEIYEKSRAPVNIEPKFT